jgi:uncharacterized membrane protein YkvA (DUF1232 family)
VETIKNLIQFIKDVASDTRIPERDKKMVLACLALIVSPIDIIPDWIPILGVLDDMVLLAILLDYFFSVLDEEILLSHYPWGMKSFARVRRGARVISWITPGWVKKYVWKYEKSPYK